MIFLTVFLYMKEAIATAIIDDDMMGVSDLKKYAERDKPTIIHIPRIDRVMLGIVEKYFWPRIVSNT